jgi:hypothetical protein
MAVKSLRQYIETKIRYILENFAHLLSIAYWVHPERLVEISFVQSLFDDLI